MPLKVIGLSSQTPVYAAPAYGVTGRVVTITNTDKANRVYYSDSPGTINTESSYIDPLSAEVFDGQSDVWMSTTDANITVTVQLKIGSQNYAPGLISIQGNVQATVSGSVSVTGSSVSVSGGTVDVIGAGGFLLPGQTANLLTDAATHPIASGANFAYAALDLAGYTSFNVLVNAQSASQATGGAALSVTMQVAFYDDAGLTSLVYSESVSFWAGNSLGNNIPLIGSVPVHGRYCVLTFFNNGTASNVNMTKIVVTGSFRSPVYSSWRQAAPVFTQVTITGVTVSSLNTPQNAPYSNTLGQINVTPGTGLRAYLLPLFSGPVFIEYQISGAALLNSPSIVDAAFATSGNVQAGINQPGIVWFGDNAVTTPGTIQRLTIMLPRSPCMLVVNPAATSNIFFSAVGQQGY